MKDSLRILIIEDNTNFGNMLVTFLSDIAYEIVLVKNWEEANEYLATHPDVAIVDLQLADLNIPRSVAQVQDLRARDKNIVIIILSGFVSPDIHRALLEIPVEMVEEKQTSYSVEKLFALVIMGLMKAIKRGSQGQQGQLVALMQKATSLATRIVPNLKLETV